MAIEWTQLAMVAGTFGAALGTSLGAAIVNSRQRKTLNSVVNDKTEPLRDQNASQEERIQRLELMVLGWQPRKADDPKVQVPVLKEGG